MFGRIQSSQQVHGFLKASTKVLAESVGRKYHLTRHKQDGTAGRKILSGHDTPIESIFTRELKAFGSLYLTHGGPFIHGSNISAYQFADIHKSRCQRAGSAYYSRRANSCPNWRMGRIGHYTGEKGSNQNQVYLHSAGAKVALSGMHNNWIIVQESDAGIKLFNVCHFGRLSFQAYHGLRSHLGYAISNDDVFEKIKFRALL